MLALLDRVRSDEIARARRDDRGRVPTATASSMLRPKSSDLATECAERNRRASGAAGCSRRTSRPPRVRWRLGPALRATRRPRLSLTRALGVDVRAVAEEQPHAGVAQLGEARFVGELAVGRAGSNLKVAAVQHEPARCGWRARWRRRSNASLGSARLEGRRPGRASAGVYREEPVHGVSLVSKRRCLATASACGGPQTGTSERFEKYGSAPT